MMRSRRGLLEQRTEGGAWSYGSARRLRSGGRACSVTRALASDLGKRLQARALPITGRAEKEQLPQRLARESLRGASRVCIIECGLYNGRARTTHHAFRGGP